ncbi:MAG: GTPase Era [Anaerolineales bacterium]|nr:GTPase Era [Anaerolineales bacterium]
MTLADTPQEHRSGFVAISGRPNVGKSTLINAYLGQQIAAVSPKPQTTRRRQLGILTLPTAQVIFIDTPGIHKPLHKLGEKMNAAAQSVLEDADLVLVVFSMRIPPTDDDRRVAERIKALEDGKPVLGALNKVDLVSPANLVQRSAAFEDLLPGVEIIPVSATHGDNRDLLLERILEMLPSGPQYYPEEDITDLFERDIAADLIRAAALHLLRDEVPHAISVRIDEYKDRNEHGAYIEATLFVERDSQKGIVIGKGGTMLREIGTRAREEIEVMSGRKVYLKIRVKVMKGWRNDERALKRMGFDPENK